MHEPESANLSPGAGFAAEKSFSDLVAQQQHEDKNVTQGIEAEKKKQQEKEKLEKAQKEPPKKPKKN